MKGFNTLHLVKLPYDQLNPNLRSTDSVSQLPKQQLQFVWVKSSGQQVWKFDSRGSAIRVVTTPYSQILDCFL